MSCFHNFLGEQLVISAGHWVTVTVTAVEALIPPALPFNGQTAAAFTPLTKAGPGIDLTIRLFLIEVLLEFNFV